MSVEERLVSECWWRNTTQPPNPTYTTPLSKSRKKERSGLKALSGRQKGGVKEQRSRGGGRPPKKEHVATTSESRSGQRQAAGTQNVDKFRPVQAATSPATNSSETHCRSFRDVVEEGVARIVQPGSQAEACREENSITPCKFTAHRRRSKSAPRSRWSRHMPVLTGTETNCFEATHQPFSCEGSPREGQELRGAPVGPACLGDLTG